jgi:hypothetical protein
MTDWDSLFGQKAAQAVQAVAAPAVNWGREAFQQIAAHGLLNANLQNQQLTRAHVAQSLSGEKLGASQLYEAMAPAPLGNHEVHITNIGMGQPEVPAPAPAPQQPLPYVQPAPITAPQPYQPPAAAPLPLTNPVQAVAGLAKSKVAAIVAATAIGAAGLGGLTSSYLNSTRTLPPQVIEGTIFWEQDQDVERESGSQQQFDAQASPGL